LKNDKVEIEFIAFFIELQRRIDQNFEYFFGSHVFMDKENQCIVILKLTSGWTVDFRVIIHSNFSVSAFRSNSPVVIKDLLGYQCHLGKYSQLEAIVSRAKNDSKVFVSELKQAILQLKLIENCVDFNHSDKRWSFLIELFELLQYKKNGRRYSSNLILTALSYYLLSRSCYKEIRTFLTLPPDTLTSCIGNLSDIGSINDAQRICNLVFGSLSEVQYKKCNRVQFQDST
jgi:hypothetical protein